MVVVRGRLTPEVGAVLRRALEAALDAERRPAASDGAGGGTADAAAEVLAPMMAQRRADAMGVVAECALAGGLDKGTAGDRYQVVVHVDADTLAAGASDGEPSADGAAIAGSNLIAVDTAGDGSGTSARDAGGQPPGPDVPAGTSGPGSATASGAAAPSPAAGGAAAVRAAASGQSALDEAGGIHVAGETARRLACDAARVTMRYGPAGKC